MDCPVDDPYHHLWTSSSNSWWKPSTLKIFWPLHQFFAKWTVYEKWIYLIHGKNVLNHMRCGLLTWISTIKVFNTKEYNKWTSVQATRYACLCLYLYVDVCKYMYACMYAYYCTLNMINNRLHAHAIGFFPPNYIPGITIFSHLVYLGNVSWW